MRSIELILHKVWTKTELMSQEAWWCKEHYKHSSHSKCLISVLLNVCIQLSHQELRYRKNLFYTSNV